jgi:outer membrane protein
MKRTLTMLCLVAAMATTLPVLAQSAPAAGSAAAPATVAAPTRVGIIRIQDAIVLSNEGKRDFDALQKKYEPKQAELQKANQKLQDDQKQFQTQGDKMNDDAKGKLQKQIEKEQRDLQTSAESAQQDFQGEQNDIANRIGQKMMQVLDKYAKDNGYAVILDVSNPQTPVLWANMQSVDVTETVVNLYNVASGVAAPPASATAPKPAATTPRPNTPSTGPAGAVRKPQ